MESLPHQPKLGIVIGSGGIQSLTALPLLTFLKENGVKVEIFAGCGGGAVLATLFAMELADKQIISDMGKLFNRKTQLHFNYRIAFDLFKIPGFKYLFPLNIQNRSILNVTAILKRYQEIFKQLKFSHLKTKVLVQATDWRTGRGVTIEEGYLSQVLYASNALFPFQPPIFLNDQWLVAGFYTEAVPLLSILKHHLDQILILGFNQKKHLKFKNSVEYYCNLLNYSFTHMQKGSILLNLEEKKELLPILIEPDEPIRLWDNEKIDYIIEIGKEIKARYGELLLSLLRQK